MTAHFEAASPEFTPSIITQQDKSRLTFPPPGVWVALSRDPILDLASDLRGDPTDPEAEEAGEEDLVEVVGVRALLGVPPVLLVPVLLRVVGVLPGNRRVDGREAFYGWFTEVMMHVAGVLISSLLSSS